MFPHSQNVEGEKIQVCPLYIFVLTPNDIICKKILEISLLTLSRDICEIETIPPVDPTTPNISATWSKMSRDICELDTIPPVDPTTPNISATWR